MSALVMALAGTATAHAATLSAPTAFSLPTAHATTPVCEKRVQFALVDARTSGCLKLVSTSPDTWESTDEVNLNGIPLRPLSGRLVLKAPTTASPGGSIAVKTKIVLAGVTVFDGGFDRALPEGGPGDLRQLASLSAPEDTSFKGFKIGGSISLELGKDKGADGQGYARFQLIVDLPNVFRSGTGKDAGGLTGTFAIRTDASGVHADALKIEIANAYIGQVLLKSVCISYVSASSPTTPCSPPKFGATELLSCENNGANRWDGSALIQLPTADKPEVGLFAGTANGAFAYAGAQVTNLGKAAPLAPGVYLDKVGIAICLNPSPMKIRGSIGVRFGPEINGSSVAYLDGTVTYTDSRPWVLEASGTLSLFDKEAASGYFTYRSDGAIDFGFELGWNFYNVLELGASVKGWYLPAGIYTNYHLLIKTQLDQERNDRLSLCLMTYGTICAGGFDHAYAEFQKIPRLKQSTYHNTRFDVYGEGHVCAFKIVCAGGEVAVSSVGLAGCVTLIHIGDWILRGGAGYKWNNGSNVDLMGSSCDVGPYRASKDAVAAAGGARTVRLRGEPAVVLRITGLDKPPNVLIAGPGGRTVTANGPGQLKLNKYFYLQDAGDHTTVVTIDEPAAGTWTIRPLPGSSPIVAVSEAQADPDPQVDARVTGTGIHQLLAFSADSNAGQTITFWERGRAYEQVLGTATGSCLTDSSVPGHRPPRALDYHPHVVCGVIPFSPARGRAGVRNIIAVVSDSNGEPVTEFKVASYRAGGEALPSRPRNLTIARKGTTVTITWAPSSGAYDYDVDIDLSDGSKLLDVQGSRRRRIVLHGIPRHLTMTVLATGLRVDNMQGATARAVSRGLR